MVDDMGSNNDLILGELRGQVRELIHSVNNLTMQVTGLTREVSALGHLAGDLADLKARVAVMEAWQLKTEGANGLLGVIMKSPLVAWIVAAAGVVYGYVTTVKGVS